jgi:hypothetical protein
MKKRWIVLFMVTMLSACFTVAYASNPIKITVDGKELTPDVPAQIVEGRTMVPIKFVAEALGATVSWDADTSTVVITSNKPVQPKEQVFTGKGNDYTGKFVLQDGLTYIKYTYTGENNFVAWLLDANGNQIELIANEIDSCDGKTAISAKAGTYLINVTSSGSWTLTIGQ